MFGDVEANRVMEHTHTHYGRWLVPFVFVM